MQFWQKLKYWLIRLLQARAGLHIQQSTQQEQRRD